MLPRHGGDSQRVEASAAVGLVRRIASASLLSRSRFVCVPCLKSRAADAFLLGGVGWSFRLTSRRRGSVVDSDLAQMSVAATC